MPVLMASLLQCRITLGHCKFDGMDITRIDCHFFRGTEVPLDQASYVAVNPHSHPGSVVMAGAGAVRRSIGGHVASKLALQHFVEAVLDGFSNDGARGESKDSYPLVPSTADERTPLALRLVEEAFRAANHSVYQFGHKLAAGGRLAASLIGVVIEDGVIAAGRVGLGNAYLCRDMEVFPFFETHAGISPESQGADTLSGNPSVPEGLPIDGFVGTQSLVSVELASVPLHPRDVVFLSAEALDSHGERELYGVLEDYGFIEVPEARPRQRSAFGCEKIVQALYPNSEMLPFAMIAVVGPEAFYLAPVRVVPDAGVSVGSQFSSHPGLRVVNDNSSW